MDSALIFLVPALPLMIGWLLDFLFGDPQHLPHPVVWMGRWISFWEHRLNRGRHRVLWGALLAVSSILLVYFLVWAFLYGLQRLSPWLAGIASCLLIFYSLAGCTLRREVRWVFEALDRSLPEGRRQVARIVGRDTQQLSAQEVRTAALETLAENLSDGVVAPLFWLALLGVPGMMAYKMGNTLDSMIAYHTPRYLLFGRWAAHIDDIANYLPARITAFLLLLAGHLSGGALSRCSWIHRVRFVLRFGPQHASPNSGWPEAALASLLDCRFGGSHEYFGELFYKPYIGSRSRELDTRDMQLSLRWALLAEVFAVALVFVYMLLG